MNSNKTLKLVLLLIFISILTILLLFSVSNTISKKRHLPSLDVFKKELSVRGDILSKDRFKISTSKKIYKATIDTRCFDDEKKDLFITLFSIYSNIDKKFIEKKINSAIKNKLKGNLVLSYSIDSRTAKNLKLLARKLTRFNVFKSSIIGGRRIIIGLDIVESGEKRLFPYKDTLSPIIGFLSKYENTEDHTKVRGIKGLEKQYDKYLNNSIDGFIQGERDILSRIILNNNSTVKPRLDGASITLNISLRVQKNIEIVLDHYKKKFGADEIIASVMDSTNGDIYSLATSNRFNPQKINQEDVDNGYLPTNAIEHQFEPGSILKPISVSLVDDLKLIKKNEIFNSHISGKRKGRYKIGKHVINDDHLFKKQWITLNDIIIHSSNIGVAILAQRLSGEEFYNGYKKFGLSIKTGIDLPFERRGLLHSIEQYNIGKNKKVDNIYKATDSYGHGITATFMQMLKAYSVFNNDGFMVTPKLINFIEYDNKKQIIKPKEPIKVLKKTTANRMKKMLIQTVESGTGVKTKIDSIEIGGKTGTANIVHKGKYIDKYNSSFFGFANGNNKKYTIGVTVRNPKSFDDSTGFYYASKTAVPIFKEIVIILHRLNYLKKIN